MRSSTSARVGARSIGLCPCVLMLISGCALLTGERAEDLELVLHRGTQAYVAWARVYRDDDGTVIRGAVARHPLSRSSLRGGHVDVRVVDAEGCVVVSTQADFWPRDIPLKGFRRSRFSTRLACVVPAQSVVHLQYHQGDH